MPSTTRPSIAVIGGGPAGLTAAVILKRAGYQVQVFERDPSPTSRAQGGTLDLHADKGQKALRHAGLLEAFRATARHGDQGVRRLDPFSAHLLPSPHHGDGTLDRPEIDRGTLRTLLLNALPTETVHWGHKLDRLETGPASTHRVYFTNGNAADADIIIGADGGRSCLRPFLSSTSLIYTGITFFEGWIHDPSPRIAALVGHGSLFCFGGPEAVFAQRAEKGRICLYAAMKCGEDWPDAGTAPDRMTSQVRARYSKWHPDLRQLLEACPNLTPRPIHTLPPDFGWSPQDGLTLIGDAAHLMPPVGLGVNFAMLDASDIATALCDEPDWRVALRRAEHQILQRAREAMPGAIEGFMDWFRDSPIT